MEKVTKSAGDGGLIITASCQALVTGSSPLVAKVTPVEGQGLSLTAAAKSGGESRAALIRQRPEAASSGVGRKAISSPVLTRRRVQMPVCLRKSGGRATIAVGQVAAILDADGGAARGRSVYRVSLAALVTA